jgi:hypothetical protein
MLNAELRTLFMPGVIRTAKRGQVQFFNQLYQAPDLMRRDIDGREVSVRYDIHNPNYVLIYTLGGEFVCEAQWDANRIDYFPKPSFRWPAKSAWPRPSSAASCRSTPHCASWVQLWTPHPFPAGAKHPIRDGALLRGDTCLRHQLSLHGSGCASSCRQAFL